MSEFKQRYKDDGMKFLFLCPVNDAKILVGKYKKANMPEYVRLACLALAFGFRLVFIKITQMVEKDIKDFFSGLDALDGNFHQLDIWVENFIDGGCNAEVQALCREMWTERKKELNKPDFSVRSLL